MRDKGDRERSLHNGWETDCQSIDRHTHQWTEDEAWTFYRMAQKRTSLDVSFENP